MDKAKRKLLQILELAADGAIHAQGSKEIYIEFGKIFAGCCNKFRENGWCAQHKKEKDRKTCNCEIWEGKLGENINQAIFLAYTCGCALDLGE